MLCTLSRWLISRAEDTRKKLPSIVARHVRRCGACGAYARAAASLSTRLKGERSAWLAAVPEFPAGLERDREEPEMAPGAAATARPRPRRSWLALRPVPVAVSLLVLVAAGFVLFRVVPRETAPTPADRVAARAAIKTLTTAPEGLQGVIGEAESSLDKERRILESSVVAAVDYLQARLNIKIERKATPKSL
ncbi:MAG TPA: hypothetical protein VKT17_08545 [Acidobacteriota bacterium]|nr:hypothetical protein [Acidobacteriota bacterium]